MLTNVSVSSVEDAVSAGQKLVQQSGCGAALLTLGSKGAVWVDSSGEHEWVDAEVVKAVDTTVRTRGRAIYWNLLI